jgi:hypothetical protein
MSHVRKHVLAVLAGRRDPTMVGHVSRSSFAGNLGQPAPVEVTSGMFAGVAEAMAAALARVRSR